MVQLTFHPNANVWLNFEDLELRRGAGAHRVTLRFLMRTRDCPAAATLLSGDLQLEFPSAWLGQLHAEEAPITEPGQPMERHVRLTTTWTDHQLAALERLRRAAT